MAVANLVVIHVFSTQPVPSGSSQYPILDLTRTRRGSAVIARLSLAPLLEGEAEALPRVITSHGDYCHIYRTYYSGRWAFHVCSTNIILTDLNPCT